jgi:hypothetical protein
MNTRQFYSALTILLIIFVFALTFFIISSEKLPLGSDTYFHLKLARLYTSGNFTGAISTMFQTISYPYPPFFQLVVLSPVALSSNPYLGLRILEALFMPLTFLVTLWLVWKHASPKAALFTGIALLASWSFVDGTLQARPESLDLLLFPIVAYAMLEARKKTAGAASTIMVWSHGLASLSSLFGMFVLKLKDKAWRRTFLYVAIATSPIIALSFIFFGGAIATWGIGQTQSSNPQQWMFWHNPFPWIIYYAGLSLLGIPFLLRRHKTRLETLFTYAFIGNTAMLLFWADRWLQYSVIPLACLFGIGVSRWHGKKLYIVLAVSVIILALYISVYYLTSLHGLWWQPGD